MSHEKAQFSNYDRTLPSVKKSLRVTTGTGLAAFSIYAIAHLPFLIRDGAKGGEQLGSVVASVLTGAGSVAILSEKTRKYTKSLLDASEIYIIPEMTVKEEVVVPTDEKLEPLNSYEDIKSGSMKDMNPGEFVTLNVEKAS